MAKRSTTVTSVLNLACRALALGLAGSCPIAGLAAAQAPTQAAVDGEAAAPVLASSFAPIHFGDDDQHAWTAPFVPGASYSPSVTRPEALLGQAVGSRIASHDEMLALFRIWAAESERVVYAPYGRTYEGRELVRLIITSPRNHARLGELRAGVQRLFDPRGLSDADGERLVSTLPGVAWMGYGIHGDETSAAEASVPVAYHLAAAEGPAIERLLDEVVIVLDPCLNPDGRERIRSMVVQNAGYRANLDHGAMQRGRWPYGRGNHYLFDMNRDWMAGEAPETRARWRALLDLPPQLFVDAHEMSGLDTFLFYPQSSPKNPHLPTRLFHWQGVLADEAARAFDAYAWGYYTREWADAWAPIYSDAWGSLTGAIGMLYEQGRTIGAPLLRASGEVVAYREAVHGQVAASLSNLETFRAHHTEILRDWLAHRRAACAPGAPWQERVFAVVPGADVERHARLLRTLTMQGIEVFEARGEFLAANVVGAFAGAGDPAQRAFPAGTWLVPAAQPQGALVRAFLDFDPRIDAETLRDERERLERGKDSRLYDITAWDLGRQYGVDAAWIDAPSVARAPLTELLAPRGPVTDPRGAYAWVLDGDDGRSVRFVAQALERGLAVHVSDREFTAVVATAPGQGGVAERAVRRFPRGSFVLRRHENRGVKGDVDLLVAEVGAASGGVVWSVATGRSTDDGPDLGGQHFQLLERPRVAIASNAPVSTTDFGALWRYLDEELGLHTTLLDCQAFGGIDLRRFNVLVLPPGATRGLAAHAETLRGWVENGGTLIAVGSAATGLIGAPFELSSTVLRPDALEDLDAYAFLVRRERAALDVAVDAEAVYAAPAAPAGPGAAGAAGAADAAGAVATSAGAPSDADPQAAAREGDPDAAREDAWRARFSPAGVVLAAAAHPDAWITAGVGADLAVEFSGSDVWLTKDTPAVRLASAERLRLGGLLWPEARERIADTAWLTVERQGRGQVIGFAGHPVFRGSWRGTARLFANAVVLGPGNGTDVALVR
ncbi:MAG: M14 family zinc carboxypeptidase [Planctomycetota bacterium]